MYTKLVTNHWDFDGGNPGSANIVVSGVFMNGAGVDAATGGYIDFPSPLSSFGVVFRYSPAVTGSAGTTAPVEFYDTSFSTTQPLFRLFSTSGNWGSTTFKFQAWNGASWVDLGTSTNNAPTSSGTAWAIWIVMNNTTGVLKAVVNGTVEINATGLDTILTAATSIDRVMFRANGNGDAGVGCVGLTTHDPEEEEIIHLVFNGVGATSNFTGTYFNVDDNALDTNDVIASSVAGDVTTYNTLLPAGFLAGYTVEGVFFTAYARRGSAAPTRFQFAERHSGVDYFSSNISVGQNWGSYSLYQTLNPATAALYTISELDTMQFGVKAIA